jgi:hypothetical protein
VSRRILHFPIVTPIYTKRFIGSVGTFASCILSYTKNGRSRPSRLIKIARARTVRCRVALCSRASADHCVVGREHRKIALR